MENLIPFGYQIETDRYLDVNDVERGDRCGCICPSCKTPLVARKGDERIWHFAHKSRKTFECTETKCEYSVYVSVRMMARQIIGDKLEIKLPEYIGTAFKQLVGSKSFTVAKEQIVTLENVCVEHTYNTISVDIQGDIRGIPFVIYFTHPGRESPALLASVSGERCGIVEIDLGIIANKLFGIAKKTNRSFQEILGDFLYGDLSSKRWLYHPRYALLHKDALDSMVDPHPPKNRLDCPIDINNNNSPKKNRKTFIRPKNPMDEVTFLCRSCKVKWKGDYPGESVCPTCNSRKHRTVFMGAKKL